LLKRVLRLLEYEKIKQQLSKHTASSLGKEKVIQLLPSIDIEEVMYMQDITDEGAVVLRLKGHVPLGGIYDIRPSLKRSEIGGMLNQEELRDISSTIYSGRRLKKFIEDMHEDGTELPLLTALTEQIVPAVDIEREINRCIDEDGRVLDSASDALRTVRQQLRTYESRIREKLESIVRSSSYQKMLSDAIITIRNDRYVIPVKQEYRSAFGGIVHDQSSSGATLFMEPQAIVTINNQLREAKAKEVREIEKILKYLTEQVAEEAQELLHNVKMLSELDFTFAKALYSKELAASKPKMNSNGYIHLKHARHPLIAKEEVVPSSLELGNNYTSIVITGPNTGGKTVTLKTIGLLTLMAQSGLQIPAEDDCEMAVFKAVFADIGDEQSIEQNLSTFSSHMTNIVDILEKVDHESLVLFDELGAGTDPQEGAALAISILDDVYKRGARIVATTHYSELKAYAYNREGVINASVEFNVETLRPTYRLLIGVPGRSNAFEISRRLGLNETIIDHAKSQISSDTSKVNKMIASLEDTQKQAEQDRADAKELRAEAEKLHTDLKNQLHKLDDERDRLFEEAERKAEEELRKAKAEAEKIMKELRNYKRTTVKEHQLIDAKKRLEEASPKLRKSKKADKTVKTAAENLKPGDEVKVLSIEQKGHIVEKVSEKEYVVQVGIMKMKMNSNNLQKIKEQKQTPTKSFVAVKGRDYHVKTELDLRGKRYEDAQLEVERYLDDAILAGYSQVSIIHGKGTGALRKGVQDLLKSHTHVKGTRMGGTGEGGSGVTVVELK
jgi:DNA mismatch repair protein MutS2